MVFHRNLVFCLETLNNWSLANCLYSNSDKTNFMVFLLAKISVLVNVHQIAQVHSSKYLDLYIDDDLNWKNHIEYTMVNY